VLTLRPDGAEPPTGTGAWADTRLQLPGDLGSTAYRHVFTGATIRPDATAGAPTIAAAALFEHFPVALLVPCSG
jgi:maltooligosyltrehalose synthase